MKSTRPNQIAALRKRQKLSQIQLAEMVGSHWVTISRLERGQLQLNEAWLDKLSNALHVSPSEIINWEVLNPIIRINGEILDGKNVSINPLENEIEIKDTADRKIYSKWFIVSDDNFWPICKHGDLACFIPMAEFQAAVFLDRLCIVINKNLDGGHIGFLEHGSTEGLYNVRPMMGKPILNLAIGELWVCIEIRFSMPGVFALLG